LIRRQNLSNSFPYIRSKTEGALQDLDEAGYWLKPIDDSGIDSGVAVKNPQGDAMQLVAIFVSITRKAKERGLPA
jgi:hypothetical protein